MISDTLNQAMREIGGYMLETKGTDPELEDVTTVAMEVMGALQAVLDIPPGAADDERDAVIHALRELDTSGILEAVQALRAACVS